MAVLLGLNCLFLALTQVQLEFRGDGEALNTNAGVCNGVEEGRVVLEGPSVTVYQVQKEILNIIMALVNPLLANDFYYDFMADV